MPFEVTRFFSWVIVFVLMISVFSAIINWKRLPSSFHYLSYYLCWNLLIEVLARVLTVYEINNLPLLHLYTTLEFILFSFFYRKTGLLDKWPSRLFTGFIIVVAGLLLLNSVFLQNIWMVNSYAKTLVQVILITFATGFIFQLRENSIEQQALNLANASILIYFSGSLFIFMFANFFIGTEYSKFFWDANVLLNLFFQIIMLISIWKASKLRKSPL